VLKSGDGPRPPDRARCFVHFAGRLLGADPSAPAPPAEDADGGDDEDPTGGMGRVGRVFMDTRAEGSDPKTIVAGKRDVEREKGLFLAVQHMRPGECATFRVSPEYAYGSEGSFSFPHVPGGRWVEYDIELLAVDEDEGPEGMLFEERLAAAAERRAAGNERFQAGDYAGAVDLYTRALGFVTEDLVVEVQQLSDRHLDQALDVKCPVHLNIAACCLKLDSRDALHEAVRHCSEVLKYRGDSPKALFRRGTARLRLGQSQAAIEDLSRAQGLAPGDRAIGSELARARREARETERAGAGMFKGKFAGKGLGFEYSRRPEDDELKPLYGAGAGGGDGGRDSGGGAAGTSGGGIEELARDIRERAVRDKAGKQAVGGVEVGWVGALWQSVAAGAASVAKLFSSSAGAPPREGAGAGDR